MVYILKDKKLLTSFGYTLKVQLCLDPIASMLFQQTPTLLDRFVSVHLNDDLALWMHLCFHFDHCLAYIEPMAMVVYHDASI